MAPPKRRLQRRETGWRRSLACLMLTLAAGAVTVYQAMGGVGGGGTKVVHVPHNGLAGGARGGPSSGVGVASAAPEGKAGKSLLPPPPAEGIAGAAAEGTAGDGVFKLKVGQMEVRASESMDFSSEDAVPGLMWLPIGLRDVGGGDPWVTMCLMNYKHYQDNPSATPMFAHLNTFSKCGIKRKDDAPIAAGMVEVLRMSSLLKSMEEQGRPPLPPKGFVYHETRCGSTLVANMLASLPPSRVFSESKPPTQAIRECHSEGCSSERVTKLFRDVVGLMGRRRRNEQHEHLYFKFQNSKFIPEISQAYPEVPWVFIFRDPVEVMVSNLKSFAGAPCVRIPRQERYRKTAQVAPGALSGGGRKGVTPTRSKKPGHGGGENKAAAMEAWRIDREKKRLREVRGGGGGSGGGESRRLAARREVACGGGGGDGGGSGSGGSGEARQAGVGEEGWGGAVDGPAMPRGYMITTPGVDSAIVWSGGGQGGWREKKEEEEEEESDEEEGGGARGDEEDEEDVDWERQWSMREWREDEELTLSFGSVSWNGHPLEGQWEEEEEGRGRTKEEENWEQQGGMWEWKREEIASDLSLGSGGGRGRIGSGGQVGSQGLPRSSSPPLSALTLGAEDREEGWRRMLLPKRSPSLPPRSQRLDMNMTMDCADWLKAMCMSAVVGMENSPTTALFVDYSNLPDAVPEFIFPQHFGMSAEVAQTVPDWKDLMLEAAGTYSKGVGRTEVRQFTNDVEAKHKIASPLIVEATGVKGGLYDVYHSLEALQVWRKPAAG